MVYGRNPHPRLPSFGGPGAGMPPPRDLVVLLAVVFVTFSLRFFDSTRIVPQLLELTPLVWRRGLVWQLVTYPLAGVPAGTLWFLVELLILFFFGRDVFHRLGRRAFWTTLAVGAVAASVVAVAVHVVATLAGAFIPNAFLIMQGQHMLLTLVIAAFATLYGDATVYLFFVLPVRARWFLWIEVLFGFMAFLGSKDLPGFLGICAGVAGVWLWLKGPGARRTFRDLWLRSQRWWLERRMKQLRRKRGFQVVPGEKGRGGGGSYLNRKVVRPVGVP
jgi:hypothetical protein